MADLELLVEHRHRMWSDIGRWGEAEIVAHDPRYRAWVAERLPAGAFEGFIAERGGRVLGSGGLWWMPEQPRPGYPTGTVPYILSMYTAPEHRGRGVASAIVRAMLRRARVAGAPRVTLHASDQGRPVYARLGFERSW